MAGLVHWALYQSSGYFTVHVFCWEEGHLHAHHFLLVHLDAKNRFVKLFGAADICYGDLKPIERIFFVCHCTLFLEFKKVELRLVTNEIPELDISHQLILIFLR